MGTLHLVPVPIVPARGADAIEGSALRVLPPATVEVARQTHYFLVENARSARAFLKAVAHPEPVASLQIVEMGRQAAPELIDRWLWPLRAPEGAAHTDAAVLSEAGCPGIADPGAAVVARAHELGIRVIPWVGPSSILLALMGSGMNGQQFRFLGYLPQGREELGTRLRDIEHDAQLGETQIFIETPYRNVRLFESILEVCDPSTRLGLAIELTAIDQSVVTRTIGQWRTLGAKAAPTLERRTAVFLMHGSAGRSRPARAVRQRSRR
ncbi:MAG TPA: SAM-dependent methyltransferase [Burkholderiaceae bacterium]|nr:SAM-dependent methyltransferase [Burkholderiaceae bacterium]